MTPIGSGVDWTCCASSFSYRRFAQDGGDAGEAVTGDDSPLSVGLLLVEAA